MYKIGLLVHGQIFGMNTKNYQDSYAFKDLHELRQAETHEEFAAYWLKLQGYILGKTLQSVVVQGPPSIGPFVPIAIYPEGKPGSAELVKAIEQAIASERTSIQSGLEMNRDGQKVKYDLISCPIVVDQHICGAVAFSVEHSSNEVERQRLAEQLEWGTGWLEQAIRRKNLTPLDRLSTILNLLATSLHYENFPAASTAVATELASEFLCERVSIGFIKGHHIQLKALSHSASFEKKANLVRALEAAMDEAIDQQATIVVPVIEDAPLQVIKSHEVLLRDHEAGAVCTVPFSIGGKLLGALTLERPIGETFDNRTIELAEHAASLLGPILEIKRRDDRWLIDKAVDSAHTQLAHLFGSRYVAKKLIAIIAIAALLFFSIAEGDYRVTGKARLEGTVQRAISVPIAGYIGLANVRAGDIVKKGDVMFTMDERDLRLERLKWGSQQAQHKQEYNEALAEHDRAKIKVLKAQIEQAEAQIALVEEQLRRLQITAPFDGFVVTGDLSQSLGAPVERGDILFELAPLNDYRIIMNIDEREIGDIKVAQTGLLALAGMPDEYITIEVAKITPIATAEEGTNFFRIEASLTEGDLTKLRPGMEGVGKIFIDQRKLIWIWTHKVVHWLRMFVWSWWP